MTVSKSMELRRIWRGAGLGMRDKYQFQWWAVSLVNAVPFAGKKKGADSGIDGLIYFKPEGQDHREGHRFSEGRGKRERIAWSAIWHTW